MGCDVLYIIFSLLQPTPTPSPPLPPPSHHLLGDGGGGGWDIYSEGLYRRHRWNCFLWVGIGTLGGVIFFQVGPENTLYKNSDFQSQTKNDSDCIFYSFLPLVTYLNNFLVACIFIPVFHGIYSLPPSTNIFSVGAKKFFLSCACGKFLGDLFIGGTWLPFLEREAG